MGAVAADDMVAGEGLARGAVLVTVANDNTRQQKKTDPNWQTVLRLGGKGAGDGQGVVIAKQQCPPSFT